MNFRIARLVAMAFVCMVCVAALNSGCRKRHKAHHPKPKTVETSKPVAKRSARFDIPDEDFTGVNPLQTAAAKQTPAPIVKSPLPTPSSATHTPAPSSRPSIQPSPQTVMTAGKQKLFVKAIKLHIRMRPDRHSLSVGFKYGGDVVYVQIDGDWAKLEDGKWLRTRWLTSEKPKDFPEAKDL